MVIGSKINKIYTLEYLTSEPENKYFDRKSAAIKPSDIARHVSAFANADGGVIAIGIEEKDGIPVKHFRCISLKERIHQRWTL